MGILTKIGLTKYEACIYKALLSEGRSDASRISEASSVPKTAVYPNLRSLASKGLVQEMKGETSLFEAIPPDVGINTFLEKKQKDISSLKSEALSFAKDLVKTSKSGDKKGKKEVLWLTRGKEASNTFYYSAFPHARSSYFILGWRFQKIGEKYNLLKHFKKMIKRGVDCRILVTSPTEEINRELLKDYLESGIKIRRINLNNFSIVVVDGKECKITLKDRSLGDKYNISVLDINFAEAMNSYFLNCWGNAEII